MASERLQMEVVGLLSEPPFHIAKCAAEVLKRSFENEFEDPVIKPLLEFAWNEYLQEKKQEIKGEVWEFSSQVMCFVNGNLIGDEKGLKAWAKDMWDYTDYRPLPLYKALAEDFYVKYMRGTKHTFVYLDVSVQENPIGRLLFELFSDVCPKTCKNFQNLCSGESGDSPSGIKLHYKGVLFHRIVKNGWIQGGDIVAGKGNEGESIFGGTFEDENYAVSHNKRGILGMANKGRHTNASQFYITLQATPYMDRKHVAFGQLVEGSAVLCKMEDIPTYNERPKLNCTISDCGIFIP
ncbi:probable inactive peptidyl-prolyl cis-trans isomerase-like 6 [Rana temporaria]|uniref:probable inactive peptidyl-prolyl cis-trans isomerase-like 6 n=1 Tax=Rana temporaria TaxID=8407 RepID=UPI001AADA7AD|nr:probable inactive peptidyl-prolyl cis-trans isomerase-like 6 [Rana temporaria]